MAFGMSALSIDGDQVVTTASPSNYLIRVGVNGNPGVSHSGGVNGPWAFTVTLPDHPTDGTVSYFISNGEHFGYLEDTHADTVFSYSGTRQKHIANWSVSGTTLSFTIEAGGFDSGDSSHAIDGVDRLVFDVHVRRV